jgi:anti-sigma B factor antagonist/stage II sporulation protein AA (anti-sigma F factor antagonist)
MAENNVFDTQIQGNTIIVLPLRNISSLADESVRAEWDEVLKRARPAQINRVVFDFGNIEYFGSTMLEAMLALWKQVRQRNGKMAICNVSPESEEVLRLAKFDSLWPIFPSRAEALNEVST